MKKILLSLFCIICTVFYVKSQDIELIDKSYPDQGIRFITNKNGLLLDGNEKNMSFVKLSLFYMQENKKESWFFSLLICDKKSLSINLKARLIIKLSDNSLITLNNDEEAIDNIGSYTPNIGTVYNISPMYELSKIQLNKIIQLGVIKLRIENNIGFKDIEINKSNMSRFLSKTLQLINQEKKEKDSILNNF